jgi:tmRNA-binding protein
MGIQVTETKSLNTGAELSEFYVGLRKNQQYHMNIQISPDSITI